MYDEPESRTRLSWARTTLVVAAVAALILRGLLRQNSGPAAIALLLAASALFTVVALIRSGQLAMHGPRMPRPWGLGIAATCIVAVCAVALISFV